MAMFAPPDRPFVMVSTRPNISGCGVHLNELNGVFVSVRCKFVWGWLIDVG